MNPRRRRHQRSRRGAARRFREVEPIRVELRRKGWSEYFLSKIESRDSVFVRIGRKFDVAPCEDVSDIIRLMRRSMVALADEIDRAILYRPNALCGIFATRTPK